MDKQEAIRLFVKRNSSLFRKDPFPWEVYKRLKHVYFIDQIKFPSPRDAEIAGEILEGMILSKQISSKENLGALLELPFFKAKIQNRQYYHERLQVKLSQNAPLLNVESLEDAQYAEKVREELKKEVRKELAENKDSELQEWDERISQKMGEYNSFPSILDGKDYPLPDINDTEPVAEFYIPWWVRLGLFENPFRELEGLYKQDQALFNNVVYKTEIFLKYETLAETVPSELYRNTIFYGQFGSGKTTFFDYMVSRLNQYRIISVYVQLGAEFEVAKILTDFYREVNLQLRLLYPIYAGERFPFSEGLDDEESILQMMRDFVYHDAQGFAFFIDDLHKGDDYKAMQFLNHLQVLASKWRRATNLKIGFFIAGSNEWKPIIDGTPKFSGSVDKLEKMPLLNLKAAFDAVNRRLKAYAKNPENPRQIERKFVEHIYHGLQQNEGDLTFRGIMRAVLAEFEMGHFDALSANPINLSKKKLEEIELIFSQNPSVVKQFKSITSDPTLNSAHKERCLELLIRMYINNGFAEEEIREEDAPFLQRLQRAGLIVKVFDNLTNWKISKDLYSLNNQVIKELSLSMEDYLLNLFLGKAPDIYSSTKPHNEEFDQLDKLITFVNRDLQFHFVNDVKRAHKRILESKDKYLNLEVEPHVALQNLTESLSKLTKAFILSKNALLPPISDKDLHVLQFWKDFWWSSEPIMQYIRAASSNIEDCQKMSIAFSLYKEAFHQILYFFVSEMENSKFYSIPISNLTNEEIRLLHECRQFLQDNKNSNIAEKLVKVIESKIRTLLYNVFTILYGEFENRLKWLDKESRGYIVSNIQKDHALGFPVSRNEFQQLGRAQYKNIMTGIDGRSEGKRNWKCIFEGIFTRNYELDVYNYLSMLAEIDIRIAHFKDGSFDQNEQDYVFDFMQKSKRFMMTVNSIYTKLITSSFFKSGPDGGIFSLCSFKQEDGAVAIEIASDEMKRVLDVLKNRPFIRIPLDDQEYVEGAFGGVSYRKVYAILATLYRGIKFDSENAAYTLEIADSKGPSVQMKLKTTLFSRTQE